MSAARRATGTPRSRLSRRVARRRPLLGNVVADEEFVGAYLDEWGTCAVLRC